MKDSCALPRGTTNNYYELKCLYGVRALGINFQIIIVIIRGTGQITCGCGF